MPSENAITIYGGDYAHTLGIAGRHGAGVALDYRTARVQDIFAGMLEERRFEVCEFSLANYLTLRATGQHWLTAVPVFPYRAFRHGLAVTRRESALRQLGELAGTRIGVEDYSMTAAVWFRGLLQDDYGIAPESITWVTGRRQRFPLPAGANVETTEADLEDLVGCGALDAMLGFTLRDNALSPAARRLRPVLADAAHEEQAYFARTGIYPIMHCVVMRNDVLDAQPALPLAICAAYAAAKARAGERRRNAASTAAPPQQWTSDPERFGGDPLPYGLTPDNRRVVARLATYLKQQGFIEEAADPENLFRAV